MPASKDSEISMSFHGIETPTRASRTEPERVGRPCILTINVGSSSLKFALFAPASPPERLLSGRIERIGMPGSRLVVAHADGSQTEDTAVEVPDQAGAAALVIERLGHLAGQTNVAVVG